MSSLFLQMSQPMAHPYPKCGQYASGTVHEGNVLHPLQYAPIHPYNVSSSPRRWSRAASTTAHNAPNESTPPVADAHGCAPCRIFGRAGLVPAHMQTCKPCPPRPPCSTHRQSLQQSPWPMDGVKQACMSPINTCGFHFTSTLWKRSGHWRDVRSLVMS